MATQVAEHSLESVVRGHHVYKYIGAPRLGERLFVPMWGMHMNRILCCFGDKIYEIVGHIRRIIWSAMIAI